MVATLQEAFGDSGCTGILGPPAHSVSQGESCVQTCDGRKTWKSCDTMWSSCCKNPNDYCGPWSDGSLHELHCQPRPKIPIECNNLYSQEACNSYKATGGCAWCTSNDNVHKLCFDKSKIPLPCGADGWKCE